MGHRPGAFPIILLMLMALLPVTLSSAQHDTTGKSVRLLNIDGIINPVTERYLTREIGAASKSGSAAIVLKLNTPGGLESAMRRMTQAIMESPLPVIIYVAPRGARAASAGMFITIAGHVAAMAPGTNIGAAHPVSVGGGGGGPGTSDDKPNEQDRVMMSKVVNDAVALARSIAETRSRNANWVEKAIRESASISAETAVKRNVVDLIAPDIDSLLAQVDGKKVKTAAGIVILHTKGQSVDEREMGWSERILHAITDPNIAYLLFTIGMLGVMLEMYSPGLLFPGITGALCIVLALVSFGSLPVSAGGIILIVAGVILLVIELLTEGIGIIGAAGTLAFVLGSLILYSPGGVPSPSAPDVQVSRWLVALTALIIASFFFFVIRGVLKARKRPIATGVQALVGHTGQALTDLSPSGRVQIDSEEWSAVAQAEAIRKGEAVRVVGVSGVTLKVEKYLWHLKAG